ncbi:hypothetical protein IW262DRAFT_1464963 [Armillaria fumosa]|nr:hypothetical protein IW262DRAFT_1464963 [Armillaria fumosa]
MPSSDLPAVVIPSLASTLGAAYLGQSVALVSFKLDVVVNNLVIVCVHIIYSVRLWMLGRHFHRVIPWFIAFIVLASCAAAILLSIEVFTISDFFQLHDISRTIDGALATAATVDMIIALSLCYYLLKSRVATYHSETHGYHAVYSNFRTRDDCMFINNPHNVSRLAGYPDLCRDLIPNTKMFVLHVLTPFSIMAHVGGSSTVYINSLLAMFNARDTKEHSSSSSVPRRPFKVHDEERIINTIPLSTIGQGTTTLEDSIDTGSKFELRFHGTVVIGEFMFSVAKLLLTASLSKLKKNIMHKLDLDWDVYPFALRSALSVIPTAMTYTFISGDGFHAPQNQPARTPSKLPSHA